MTFGPVGRIVVSFLMLVPLLWAMNYDGVFAIIVVPIWIIKVLPWAFRDIWAPVRVKPTDRDLLEARYADLTREPTESEPIATRQAPSRW